MNTPHSTRCARPAIALRLLLASALVGVVPGQTLLQRWEHAPSASGHDPAATGVGDVDGDGFDDVAVQNRIAILGRGLVEVRSGRDGTLIDALTGDSNHDNFGHGVVALGDIDQDGFDDFAISAPGEDAGGINSGRVTIFHGPALAPGLTIDGAAGERLGECLRAAGDVDGDGMPDLAESSPSNSPRLRIYSGATGALLRAIPNTPFEWSFADDFAGVGDLDGDGLAELAVGVPGGNPVGPVSSASYGEVRIYSGATGAVLRHLQRPAGERGFGTTVAAGGDVDADGIPDVLVGSPGIPLPPATYIRGKVFVYSGSDGALLRELRNADTLSSFGELLEGIGDLDADGHDDVAAGSSREDFQGLPPGAPRGGVQVFSGATGDVLLDVRPGAGGGVLGATLAPAGDVNADGYPDLCISAREGSSVLALVVGREPVRGTPYCLGRLHSTGDRARLTAASPSGFVLAANDVTLRVDTLPPHVPGYFMVGRQRGIVPGAGGGGGTLCIAGPDFGRYTAQVQSSGAQGRATLAVDAGAIPMISAGGTLAAAPGDTFGFQFWFRDAAATGAAGSNLSDAYAVTYR